MRHLNDGTLRRMQDEPLSTTSAEKDHYQECAACRGRAMAIATEAERAGILMAVSDEAVDTQVALQRVRHRAAGQRGYQPSLWNSVKALFVSGGGRTVRPAAALALATTAMVVLVATGVAENFVKVFEPNQFQAVQVRPDELRGLPDLSQFGDMKFAQAPKFTPVTDAAAAQSESGLTLRAPQDGAVPVRANATPPTYVVMSPLRATFIFTAAKAQAWASSHGKTLPAMPPGLDGSTLSVSAGPGVVTIYGGSAGLIGGAASGVNEGPMTAKHMPSSGAIPTPAAGSGTVRGGFDPTTMQIPTMAVVQMRSPVVNSSGASVTTIEDYLISLPGFPPDLAAQIRAIGDPATTLPVPVPTGQQSHQVDVNGIKGLFVGDSTGLGSGLVWSQGGVLYATVGTMTESEVTGVARSLH